MMEVHTTMGLKAHGLGDPEASYDELLSRETRQGTVGAISMGFAKYMDVRFQQR